MLQLSSDVSAQLYSCLTQMISVDRSQMGNIQLFDPRSQELRIVAQHGFQGDFLEHFRIVKAFDTSACGRAIGKGDVVIIDDVNIDIGFESHRAIAASAGFRAVKSVPIISANGKYLGVISTHFSRPRPNIPCNDASRIVGELAGLLEILNA